MPCGIGNITVVTIEQTREQTEKHEQTHQIKKHCETCHQLQKIGEDRAKTQSTVINIRETGRWIGGPSTQLKKRKANRNLPVKNKNKKEINIALQ
jgi:cytochrome c2